MAAYDYDCDVAVFNTACFDFKPVWEALTTFLEPLGCRLIEHTPGFKYRICPKTPFAFCPWKELHHAAKLANQGASRPQIFKEAQALRATNGRPAAPTGANCVDLEVYNVFPRKGMSIRGTNTIPLDLAEAFPVVEAIFGPLRLPVLRSPAVLDKEYGESWPHEYQVKVCNPSGTGAYSHTMDARSVRRGVWPTIELQGCGNLLGGYRGAGTSASGKDVVWRFL